jgi:PAS domain S-box-containing protein
MERREFERRLAEKGNLLRRSEARKTAIVEVALDCIIAVDHEGNIIEFNPAAEKTFGYPRDAVMGREMAELIVPACFREQLHRGLAHYLATGEGPVLNRRLELPALRADGTEFLAELAIAPVSAGGSPIFIAYLRDITERKRVEQRRAARLAITQILAEATSLKEAAPHILEAACESLGWDVGYPTASVSSRGRAARSCLD